MISLFSCVSLHSDQALRAHRGVQCVPGVPVQRQEANVQITGVRNGAGVISVICKSNVQQCVNVQEVREVQEVLWDPSYPEIRNGSMNQTLCA